MELHGHGDHLADMFRRIGELLNGDIPNPVRNDTDDGTDKLLELEAEIIEASKQMFALGNGGQIFDPPTPTERYLPILLPCLRINRC